MKPGSLVGGSSSALNRDSSSTKPIGEDLLTKDDVWKGNKYSVGKGWKLPTIKKRF